MKQGYDKEAIYDEKIAPLMKQIIEVCKAEEIPLVASFYLQSEDVSRLDGDMHVKTIIPAEGNTPEEYKEIATILYPRSKYYAAAVTITSHD